MLMTFLTKKVKSSNYRIFPFGKQFRFFLLFIQKKKRNKINYESNRKASKKFKPIKERSH